MSALLWGYGVIGFLTMCFVMAGVLVRTDEKREAVIFTAGLLAGLFWPAALFAVMLVPTRRVTK